MFTKSFSLLFNARYIASYIVLITLPIYDSFVISMSQHLQSADIIVLI